LLTLCAAFASRYSWVAGGGASTGAAAGAAAGAKFGNTEALM